jgi:hypothetical protein
MSDCPSQGIGREFLRYRINTPPTFSKPGPSRPRAAWAHESRVARRLMRKAAAFSFRCGRASFPGNRRAARCVKQLRIDENRPPIANQSGRVLGDGNHLRFEPRYGWRLRGLQHVRRDGTALMGPSCWDGVYNPGSVGEVRDDRGSMATRSADGGDAKFQRQKTVSSLGRRTMTRGQYR